VIWLLLSDLLNGNVLLGDKAYDADRIKERIVSQGAASNITAELQRASKSLLTTILQ
jgi:hypothetical protein